MNLSDGTARGEKNGACFEIAESKLRETSVPEKLIEGSFILEVRYAQVGSFHLMQRYHETQPRGQK